MNKEDQNIADVEFILSEVERFALMPHSDLIKHLKENRDDFFMALNRRSGGMLFCGRDAYNRFKEIADHTIKHGSSEAKKFNLRDYVRNLRVAFVELFVEGSKPVNQSSVSKLLNRAKHLANEELIHVTHHIPCILFFEKEPAMFNVGPVTFTRIERFLVEIDHALAAYHKENLEAFSVGLRQRHTDLSIEEVQAEATGFADTHLGKIRDYYLDYNWVASVKIPPCHTEYSKLRAERTVDAALDVLRLFVPTNSKRYRRSNAPNIPSKTCEIVTDQNNHILTTVNYDWWGVTAGEGWYDNLMLHAAPLWHLFEEAIDGLRLEEIKDELNQRLLDAINWFGQAVVEPNPAAKIVKYSAALERLTMTGHLPSGIEARIIKRVVDLNSDGTDKTYDNIKKEVGALYQYRSDLMHGAISPYSSSISGVIHSAWEVSRWAILNAAQFFAFLRENGKHTQKDLDAAYERILTDYLRSEGTCSASL